MKDYQSIGLDKNLSPVARAKRPEHRSALRWDVLDEKNPWMPPTQVSKGTLQSNLGGVWEVRDTTGGTVLLTVNPDTGTVSIAGPVAANVTLSLGTITDTAIEGDSTHDGTLTSTGIVSGGTFNNGDIGTPAVTGGTIDAVTVGTPDITGGTMDSASFGTPTLQDATVNGTFNLDTNAGSPALGADGDFAIETHSGSAILAARVGGTTFYFTSAGTLA
jgi:hypothetical protein